MDALTTLLKINPDATIADFIEFKDKTTDQLYFELKAHEMKAKAMRTDFVLNTPIVKTNTILNG